MKTSRAYVFRKPPTKSEIEFARKLKETERKAKCGQHNFIQLQNMYGRPGGTIVWKKPPGFLSPRGFESRMIIFCTNCGEFRREPEWR